MSRWDEIERDILHWAYDEAGEMHIGMALRELRALHDAEVAALTAERDAALARAEVTRRELECQTARIIKRNTLISTLTAERDEAKKCLAELERTTNIYAREAGEQRARAEAAERERDRIMADRDLIRSLLLDEQNYNATLRADLTAARGEKATHKISGVYFPAAEQVELTWEEIETGEKLSATFTVHPSMGMRLARIMMPCVYHGAIVAPVPPTEPQDGGE